MTAATEASAAGTPADQYVHVKGVATRYWAAGDAGFPVVLIDGIGQYVEAWLSNIGALAGQHRDYALDVVGYGKTDKPAGASYSMGALAQFIHDFMEALDIGRAHLAGHSMGGAIVTRLALVHPEKVNRLEVAGCHWTASGGS